MISGYVIFCIALCLSVFRLAHKIGYNSGYRNGSDKTESLLIAMQKMDTEIKQKRREWDRQGGREDQSDRSNYLDGFYHAFNIAKKVYDKETPK